MCTVSSSVIHSFPIAKIQKNRQAKGFLGTKTLHQQKKAPKMLENANYLLENGK